jgi:hypothetical protein
VVQSPADLHGTGRAKRGHLDTILNAPIVAEPLAKLGLYDCAGPRLGLTHNLGGTPAKNVSSVTILGRLQ